uniref:BTB domain-containing protein n=1 Tax=Panagrolaimus sp. PS1159 TaxID=55785 RepID=A0AC35FGI6_9BILA
MDSAVTQKHKCPIAIKLIIPEDILNEGKDPENGLFSKWCDASNIPGVKYRIGIYPNCPDEEGETWIDFEIRSSKNKLNINAVFNITIQSANHVSKKHHIFEKDGFIGQKLCTIEELFAPEKRFIVDGKMTINMDGFLMIEKEAENEKLLQFDDNFDSKLCLALWEQGYKDFTISADGKEIQAHKNVLAAQSPVFSRMFEAGMKEAKENKVIIQDFTFNIVEKAIKLCYHQSLDVFEKYLISVLNEITVCRLTNAALLSNASKLEMKCKEFLESCLKTKPIADFDILDKEFALNLLKNAFSHNSECDIV